MLTLASPATLHENYAHIYTKDAALRADLPDFAEQYRIWRETGSAEALAAITVPGCQPTVFRLRHLRGRARAELDLLLNSTFVDDEATSATFVRLAWLSIAAIENAPKVPTDDGPKDLSWTHHPEYGFQILSAAAFDLLCQVDRGALVGELGARAMKMVTLPGK